MSIFESVGILSEGDCLITMPALFNRVVIVGVGLIGSSIGLNLVKKKLAREVIGVGRNPKNLQMAVKREAVHRFVGSAKSLPLLESLSEDDLVILATPVRQIIETLPHLPKIPLITDVGSTKASIIKEATRRGLRFVGSHPIAGTEKSGAGAGTIHLFEKRVCLLTPSRGASSRDVNRIQKLWKLCGSRTVRLSASEHDEILSWVSHLPHAVVFALVKSVGDSVSAESIERFSLGG